MPKETATEPLDLVLTIRARLEGATDEADEAVSEVVRAEARRFAAAIADALEEAGLDYVRVIDVDGD